MAIDQDFDVIAIGGGAGGLVSSAFAAGLGLKVALISDGHPGGECLWTGCVPSKALIHRAQVAKIVQEEGYSSDNGEMFHKAMSHMQRARESISHHDSVETVEKSGVKVIQGRARFSSSHVIEVAGQAISSSKFIIATGASQRVPPIPGLKEAGCLTHETILDLQTKPDRLVILGGGPVGVEYAQAMLRLGVDITVVEMLDRLLVKEEPETSNFIEKLLEAEGARILTKHKAIEARKEDGAITLVVAGPEGEVAISCDQILVATGKSPNTGELNLDITGVETTDRGFIKTNKHQRTTAKHIWACGDVTGEYQFTHYADHQARVAVMNACLGLPVGREEKVVPWCTFTEPEIASVGLREIEARRQYDLDEVFVLKYDLGDFDRAILDEKPMGFIKTVIDRNGKILGTSIVGARAGELIHEFALAMKSGQSIKDLGGLIHVYPTMSAAIRNLANQYYQTVMGDSWQSKLVKKWAGLIK